MNGKLLVKRPVYPLLGLLSSLLIIVFGVALAKSPSCIWFLAAMWLVMLAFGYWRSCLAVIPAAVLLMDTDPSHYGLSSSPTQVERIFPPQNDVERETWTEGDLAEKLHDTLRKWKFI